MQDQNQEPNARKIAIVLHQETSTPGRVGQRLQQRGYTLDLIRPPLGQALPKDLEPYDAAVIFGGPMSANDSDDWIAREIDWIGDVLKAQVPFLGLCLGGQMLARQLGADVKSHPEGHVEVGYYPVTPTEHGRAMMEWPDHVYQWHREGFDLPYGAQSLATAEMFTQQAYRYGDNAFGVQFHPELTQAMMHRWTTLAAEMLTLPGAQPRDKHLRGRLQHDARLSQWLDDFLDLWLPA